jgi:hypothetical protein
MAVLADALCAALEAEQFHARHWERWPLLLNEPSLAAHIAALLTPADLPVLSEHLQEQGVPLQTVREGQRSEPRELCCDFLDGASIILNKIDERWSPIGRLCAALRSRFLHVFAVMYLTPRGSRAVPAHCDDQDVFILQVGGRKRWSVYGSPVELPYTHEQVHEPWRLPTMRAATRRAAGDASRTRADGASAARVRARSSSRAQLGKHSPIERSTLGAPLLQTELSVGSVLYLPRGFVHEARASDESASLHITLTVQTSDLNWRTLVADGLNHLHRQLDLARTPLPLDARLGGFAAHAGGDAASSASSGAAARRPLGGGVCEGVYEGGAAPGGGNKGADECAHAPAAEPATHVPAEAAEAAAEVVPVPAAAPEASAHGMECAAELMRTTAHGASVAFTAAMGVLSRKLNTLNGNQDAAISACEAVERARVGALPVRLCRAPGVEMSLRAAPRAAAAAVSAQEAAVQLVCYSEVRGGTLTTQHDPRLARAIAFIVDAARRDATFAPDELPWSDVYEQVTLCSRLHMLGVLVAAAG